MKEERVKKGYGRSRRRKGKRKIKIPGGKSPPGKKHTYTKNLANNRGGITSQCRVDQLSK